MINAKAISIISERYQGKTRIKMLGLRGSAEVVGASLITLAVGQLLAFGWTATFLAYSAGFLVLTLYLLFVPYGKGETHESKQKTEEVAKLTRSMKQLIFLSSYRCCSHCMYQYGYYYSYSKLDGGKRTGRCPVI